MKILLSHSYFLNLDPKEAANRKPYPPLASLTLAGWIRQELGFDVSFYDVMFDPDERGLVNCLGRVRPDVFIVYDDDFNFLTKMCLENMRQALFRALRHTPKTGLFVVHGSDASDQAEQYLRAGFDVVVHRNAEKRIVEILEYYSKTGSLNVCASLESVSFREAGRVIHTPPARDNLPLTEVPMPGWDIIDLSPYREMWQSSHGYFSLNVSTAHGCPYGCNWCAKPLYGRTYRVVQARRVAEQFRYLVEVLGADHIWVTDDIFALKPGWITEFANELEKVGIQVPYKCLSRADLIEEPFVAELKRSGCEEVWLGVESGSQRILDAMDKDLTIADIHTANRLLKKYDIKVGFFLQYGYPGETITDIRKTLRLIKACLPDHIGISVSYPLKGTPFYEKVVASMEGKRNWRDSGDLALMFPGEYSADFYRALHRYTHHYFGFVSMLKPQPFRGRVRRLIAQSRHIPGMIKYRRLMNLFLEPSDSASGAKKKRLLHLSQAFNGKPTPV